MSRSQRSRPGRVTIGACSALAALLLAGCGAGQLTGTSTQRSSTGGVNADAGDVVVRDAEIEFAADAAPAAVYPAGATAPLRMRIVNVGATADRLVSASSPWASSVSVTGPTVVPGGQALVVGGQPSENAAEPGTPAEPRLEPGAPDAEPAPSGAAALDEAAEPGAGPPAGAPGGRAPQVAAPAPGSTRIALTGLRDDLRAGLTYEVVLVFERAGPISLQVPVAEPTVAREPATE